jgi:hypothetical protein
LLEAEESPASADFLLLLFFVVDLLLSVPAALDELLSALVVLFLDFAFDELPLSAFVELAELSVASVLFLLLDFELLLVLAVESVLLCEESSVVFFFDVFFLVVVELSLWSCEPDELACRAQVVTDPHKSRQAASNARTTPLLDLISAPSLFFAGFAQPR